jgi:hypothetical protein
LLSGELLQRNRVAPSPLVFDLFGMWGMALIFLGFGVSEILTGKKLLKEKDKRN